MRISGTLFARWKIFSVTAVGGPCHYRWPAPLPRHVAWLGPHRGSTAIKGLKAGPLCFGLCPPRPPWLEALSLARATYGFWSLSPSRLSIRPDPGTARNFTFSANSFALLGDLANGKSGDRRPRAWSPTVVQHLPGIFV